MITFTDKAKTKIKKLLDTRGGVGISIGVKTTGCSGLAYVLEYIDKYEPDNTSINYGQNDFIVIVSKKNDVYLTGMNVDYVREGLNEGFKFNNPNERDRCGCGESFRI